MSILLKAAQPVGGGAGIEVWISLAPKAGEEERNLSASWRHIALFPTLDLLSGVCPGSQQPLHQFAPSSRDSLTDSDRICLGCFGLRVTENSVAPA